MKKFYLFILCAFALSFGDMSSFFTTEPKGDGLATHFLTEPKNERGLASYFVTESKNPKTNDSKPIKNTPAPMVYKELPYTFPTLVYKPKSVSTLPKIYKEFYTLSIRIEPLVFLDKPNIIINTVPIHIEEVEDEIEEIANVYDECVEQCKQDNVASSLVNFCIRETCGRIK